MSALTAVVLGVVQGLTEFLPVSSSAHLILARELFGARLPEHLDVAFDVACHVGTLAAVVAFFWADLLLMLRALPQLFSVRNASAHRLRMIAIGTIPIVIVGALGGGALEDTLRTPAVAAVTLTLGSLFMFLAERARPHVRSDSAITPRDATLIGMAQAAALVPGVSRSGATIGTGLLLGYHRADVARFSFLLGIPAILAAAAKEGLELRHGALSSSDIQVFLIGMATSAVVGYVAVKFLLRYLANHRLDVFAWYRLALAAILVVWLIRR
jgi:undecaprenyl-diphosphatase